MQKRLHRKQFDSNELLKSHPPRFNHPHKAGLFDLAYPDRQAGNAIIDVTRWEQTLPAELPIAASIVVTLRPDFFDYESVSVNSTATEWHVNFADPDLFYAYGSALFAQDEMQVAEHPLLACVREALLAGGLSVAVADGKKATPFLIRNVERRLAIATHPDPAEGRPRGLYGNQFAAEPFGTVRRATKVINSPTISNLIAMAAPAGGRGVYSSDTITRVFATAYTAFAAAVHEGGESVVHTGFWGCGAFGGNRTLMTALQIAAAAAAGVSQVVFHTGNEAGLIDAEAGKRLAAHWVTVGNTERSTTALIEAATTAGFRWGVSDGN